jgi:hypothetical protein
VPDVELQVVVFASPARWYDCQPDAQCKTGFKVDVVSLAGEVSDDEARASDLTHYFVGDAADIILVV